MPSNSTKCPRNGPKRRQKAPKTAQCAPAPRNQERATSSATWLKTEFRGHLVHPQPPTFYGFQASESPNKTRRPPYQWSLGGHLVQPEGRRAHAQWGPTVGPPGSPGRKNQGTPGSPGCWCTLRSFWGFLAPFWGISGSYRGLRGHQRSLGHEKVKPHVQCSSRLPSFGCFEPLLGLFWAKNSCF